jgi:cysteine dioxygenase
MERAARAFSRYRAQLPVIPLAYTRTRLMETPHFEIVAMHWAAGSVSPIHDHGDSRCWVLMLEGALDVENFERDDDASTNRCAMHSTGSMVLRADDIDFRYGPRELHRVLNTGAHSAYSLQLYAAPISTYNVFEEHTLAGRVVAATCDLHLDLAALDA